MRSAGRVFLAFFSLFFLAPHWSAEASTEWVRLVADDAEGYVVSVHGDAYMIDVGISMGARKGGLYLAYAEGNEAYGAYGESAGRQKIPLALLKVREPSTTHSFCVVVAPGPGAALRPGDRVTPISAKRARRVRFAEARPAGYLDYYEEGYFIPSAPALPPAPALPTVPALPPAPAPVSGGAPSPAPWQPLPPQPAMAPPYPPYPNYPDTGHAMLDFDANNIADARLIRTFPLSQGEMNALEIEHRGAWGLYSKGRFLEAFDSFSRQSSNYAGNYLSPYWAGMSALKLGNLQIAGAWFDAALMVNPYFAPARNAKINAPKYLLQQENQKKQPARRTARTKRATAKR
jgi:hypothetical protein